MPDAAAAAHQIPTPAKPAPQTPIAKIDPKIRKVADEFESMVIGQMLAPMFEGLDPNGPFGGGSGEEMFRPLLIDEYAKAMAKAGGLGISDVVAREMMRLQAAQAAPVAQDSAKEKTDGADR